MTCECMTCIIYPMVTCVCTLHRHNLFLKTRLNSIACDCVTFTKKVKCVKLTSLLSLGYQMQFCNSFSPKYFISCKKGHKETTKNTNVKYL